MVTSACPGEDDGIVVWEADTWSTGTDAIAFDIGFARQWVDQLFDDGLSKMLCKFSLQIDYDGAFISLIQTQRYSRTRRAGTAERAFGHHWLHVSQLHNARLERWSTQVPILLPSPLEYGRCSIDFCFLRVFCNGRTDVVREGLRKMRGTSVIS